MHADSISKTRARAFASASVVPVLQVLIVLFCFGYASAGHAQRPTAYAGTSPPVPQSSALLVLSPDPRHDATFQWASTDRILGEVATGEIAAGLWNYFPASGSGPARLVFAGESDGAHIRGNVLFESYSRAVVDVVKGSARIRYLLTGVEIEMQWIDHMGKPADAALAMTAEDQAPYNRLPGQPGGPGGFGGPPPATEFPFYEDPFRFADLVFHPAGPDGLQTISAELLSNVSDEPTNGLDDTNAFTLRQLAVDSAGFAADNGVLGLVVLEQPHGPPGERRTFDALVVNPIFGSRSQRTFFETDVGTNVYMTRRVLLIASLDALPDPGSVQTMMAEISSDVPGPGGETATGFVELRETASDSNVFAGADGAFVVALTRSTDRGALALDDFTALVTSSLLGFDELPVDAIESGENTLEFRTDLLTNQGRPIVSGNVFVLIGKQYRVLVDTSRIQGPQRLFFRAQVKIGERGAPTKKYRVPATSDVMEYREGRFVGQDAVFEFIEAGANPEQVRFPPVNGINRVLVNPGSVVIAETESQEARTELVVLKVEVVNPIDSDADGRVDDDANPGNNLTGNEFTYSTAADGTLTIPVRVRVTPDNALVRAGLANRIRARTSPIDDSHSDPTGGDVMLRWDNPFPGDPTAGVAVYDNAAMRWNATATFTRLPPGNAAFGEKTVSVEFLDGAGIVLSKDDIPIEVFFAKTAANHPGGQAGSPNWFHYWRQAVGNPANLEYEAGNGSFGQVKALTQWNYNVALPPKNRITIHDPAADADTGCTHNRIHGARRTTGIAAFWDTVIHEQVHVDQIDRADALVDVRPNTPWENGWSWNQGNNDNHWAVGPDGLPGVPRVDDDGDGTVDNLIDTGPGELGRTRASDDVQVIPIGQGRPNRVGINAGPNGVLNTAPRPGSDDQRVGNTITTGADGISQTTAMGDDVQVIPVGQGSPNENCVTAGGNGALESRPVSDDAIAGVVITTGPNGICSTRAGQSNGTDDIDLQTIVPATVSSWPDAFGLPPPGPHCQGTPIEHVAVETEPDDDTLFARQDWGNPGKNHATVDKFDD